MILTITVGVVVVVIFGVLKKIIILIYSIEMAIVINQLIQS